MLSHALALLGALPLAVEWVVASAFWRRPARTALERDASRIVPAVIGLLFVVAVVPLIFAGLELIIHRSSATELVDRVTGPSLQLIELEGLAQLPPIPAPPRDDGTPLRYYFVRDSAGGRDVVVVRSDVTPDELLIRDVTGVVVEDPDRVASDVAAMGQTGIDDATVLAGRYLLEQPGAADPVAADASAVATLAPGSAVRVRLRFSNVSVPGCGSAGDAACDARTLAGGTAHFDQLAFDADSGAPILVRSTHPAGLAPMRVFGTQETDRRPLDDLFSSPAGHVLGTWGRELRTAWVDREPGLPVDRDWRAPAILLGVAALLVVGRRIGYPVFRSSTEPDGVGVPVGAAGGGDPIRVIVTGRLARPSGGPLDVDQRPGQLRAGRGPIVAELAVETPGGAVRSPISQALREISASERGDLVRVRGRAPALALHWFGNDVVLAFESDADRDRAAALVARG